MSEISRRDFLAAAAMTAAMSKLVSAQGHDLSIYFTGLSIFVKDAGVITVGLLDHGHETILVARKNDVTATGAMSPNSTQAKAWRAGTILSGSMVFLRGTDLKITLTDPQGVLTSNALNVFPLKTAATSGAKLKTDWDKECQTAHTFSKGNFKGVTIFKHSEKCKHENQVWNLIDGSGVSKPYGTILSVVQYDVHASAAEFSLGGGTMKLKNSAPVMILQVPKTPPGTVDKRVAKDCVHYYTLLDGHTGPNLFPQRPVITPGCDPLVNVDPVYCPPTEF